MRGARAFAPTIFFSPFLCRQALLKRRPKRVSVSSLRKAVQTYSSTFLLAEVLLALMLCRRVRLSPSIWRTVKRVLRLQTLCLHKRFQVPSCTRLSFSLLSVVGVSLLSLLGIVFFIFDTRLVKKALLYVVSFPLEHSSETSSSTSFRTWLKNQRRLGRRCWWF